MANDRQIEIAIKAADEFSKTLQQFKSSLENTADSAHSSARKMETGWTSSLNLMKSAWMQAAGVVVSAAWIESAAKAAYTAEVATNKLRIQVQALGIDYRSARGEIDAAIQATSDYAIVQDDEVTAVLQQLIFNTGNYQKSLESLNLVYDLAYQKNISSSEAATIVSKAMNGNLEALGRLIPEMKSLDAELGDNATKAEKSAAALEALRAKTNSAVSEMTEHERQVKTVTKAYDDFKQSIGDVAINIMSQLVGALESAGKGFEALSKAAQDTSGDLQEWDLTLAAFGVKVAEQTHPLSNFSEKLGHGGKNANDMKDGIKGLNDELDRFKEKVAASDTSFLTGSFSSLFGSTSLSTPKEFNFSMSDFEAAKPKEPQLLEDDTAIWEMQMERMIAAKEKATTAITGYDKLMADGAVSRANIMGKAQQAYEDQLLSLVETGKFSVGAMAKVIADQVKLELVGLAAKASIYAIYETAMGLKDLAVGSPTAAVHFSSAAEFAAVAGGAMVAAAGVQALVGGTAEQPAPGTVGGDPIITQEVPSSLTTSTEATPTQDITVIINNPLSTQNWAEITENNIVPALRDAADRNISVTVESR